MTIAVWQQRPESAGWVRLKSRDPFQAPLIQPNYLVADEDRRVLLAGMKLARALLATKPLQPYYEHEAYPGPQVQSDDELLATANVRSALELADQKAGLGDHRLAGDQRGRDRAQGLLGPRVMPVTSIQERDERARVDHVANAHSP
jgi:choline dehydrogenase-like flavoprotein